MSLLTARQAVDYLARDRTTGRRALGYRRFLSLVAAGLGPDRVEFDDGGAPLYATTALDEWVAGVLGRAA